MSTFRTFPTRGALRRLSFGPLDLAVFATVLLGLYLVLRVGRGATVSFAPTHVTTVSTDPTNLPYDAARSLLRMFVALGFSTVFALTYGYVAARSRRAEKVLVPLLDILQSVPVLGFLSVTVTAFIALFPHSLLGLECASVFAIFTAQAWNMTFSFYYSVRALPRELDEASRMLRLTRWQRYWKIEVPYGIVGLVWNGMMSFGGGWFFLAACEAISVLNHTYTLPGIGSYVAKAIDDGDLGKVGLAISDDGVPGDRGQRGLLAAADSVVGALQARGVLGGRTAAVGSCSTCCAARVGPARSAGAPGCARRAARTGDARARARRQRARRRPAARPARARRPDLRGARRRLRSPMGSTGWSSTSAPTAPARFSRRSDTARSPSRA